MGYRVFGNLVIPGRGEARVYAAHRGDEWKGVERAFRRLTGKAGSVRRRLDVGNPRGVEACKYLGRPDRRGGANPVIAEGIYYPDTY